MDEAGRALDAAILWLRTVSSLDDDNRAQLAERLPWLPRGAQDAFFALTKRDALSPSPPADSEVAYHVA